MPSKVRTSREPRITYIADFLETDLDGTQRVIDIKRVETSTFRVKLKLFQAKYPTIHIDILTKYRSKFVPLNKLQRKKRLGKEPEINYYSKQKGSWKMSYIPGMEKKFTVVKNEDVEKYLNARDKSELSRLLWKIEQGRYEEGKETANTYLVVNTDESYASKIIDLMKANNHWVLPEDPNQITAQFDGDSLVLPEGLE